MANAGSPTELPIVRCETCETAVLGHLDLEDDDDREITRCLACETVADIGAVRFGDIHAIEAIGYGFVLPEAGCGRPDCQKGRCGRS